MRAAAVSVSLAVAALAPAARAYCPCYSSESASNTHDCGVAAANGTNPTTAAWNDIFDLVSRGPAAWGTAGPDVSDIGQGCGHPEALHDVPARFPCELLKAIAKQESGWRQFCVPDTPSDEVGGASRTIISFDCGYGVGQVTSGMHAGETPSFDRARVANDPTYNLATGTQILAAKWHATSCVGDNQPTIIEDWYTAAWAYNGLAYVNNPNNPNYDAGRGVYDPAIGGAAPYQERVFGWMEHTGGAWTPTEVAYPNRGDIGTGSSPPALPEPDCASPTDCVNHRAAHTTSCIDAQGGGGAGGGGGESGGGGGQGGDGGAGGSLATTATSASASVSSSGASGSGGHAPSTRAGNGVTETAGDDAGCGCEAAGATGPSRWALALVAGAACLRLARRLARRRRRR